MTNRLMRVAGLGALATGMIFAQSGPQGPAQTAPRARKAARAHAGKRLANYLNLTPEQRAQVKQIMAGARQEGAPLRQQMRQNRQALAAAIKAGNDAQIDQITRTEAPAMAQLAGIRAHAKEKIYATLTPEQKAKADQMGRFFGPKAAQRRKHAG